MKPMWGCAERHSAVIIKQDDDGWHRCKSSFFKQDVFLPSFLHHRKTSKPGIGWNSCNSFFLPSLTDIKAIRFTAKIVPLTATTVTIRGSCTKSDYLQRYNLQPRERHVMGKLVCLSKSE